MPCGCKRYPHFTLSTVAGTVWIHHDEKLSPIRGLIVYPSEIMRTAHISKTIQYRCPCIAAYSLLCLPLCHHCCTVHSDSISELNNNVAI